MASLSTVLGEANAAGYLDFMLQQATAPVFGIATAKARKGVTLQAEPTAEGVIAAQLNPELYNSSSPLARGSMEGYITNSNNALIQMDGSGYDNRALWNSRVPVDLPPVQPMPMPLSGGRGSMMDMRRPGSDLVYRDSDF